MAAFKFRLATLLKLREAERQERRAELAEAYRAEAILQEQSRQLALELHDMQQRARVAAAPGRVNVNELLDTHRYEVLLQAKTDLLKQQSDTIQAEIDRRRQALVEADRDVRILEKVRDRQQQSHEAAALRNEIKLLDETALRAYHNCE